MRHTPLLLHAIINSTHRMLTVEVNVIAARGEYLAHYELTKGVVPFSITSRTFERLLVDKKCVNKILICGKLLTLRFRMEKVDSGTAP